MKFLKNVKLSSSLTRFVTVHIFYIQDVSKNNVPHYEPWLFKHPIANDEPKDIWTTMEKYISHYKFTGYSSDESSQKQFIQSFILTTSPNQQRVHKLIDMVTKGTPGVTMELIDSLSASLIDFMELKCKICTFAFKVKREATKHDEDVHGHVCYNLDCIHSNKEQCFASEELLQRHLSNQLQCKFCPGRVFCAKDHLEDHLRGTHKKCPCPCGEYFGSRKSYLDHFFSRYPTPKSIMPRYPRSTASFKQKLKKKSVVSKPEVEVQKNNVSFEDVAEEDPPYCSSSLLSDTVLADISP